MKEIVKIYKQVGVNEKDNKNVFGVFTVEEEEAKINKELTFFNKIFTIYMVWEQKIPIKIIQK